MTTSTNALQLHVAAMHRMDLELYILKTPVLRFKLNQKKLIDAIYTDDELRDSITQYNEDRQDLTRKDYKAEFFKVFQTISNRHANYKIFADFVEMYALSISQSMYYTDEREARYMGIVKQYEKKEVSALAQLCGITILALENKMQDFLGGIFMELEIANKRSGQFFTPYCIGQMMAEILVSSDLEEYNRREFFRLSEPACGSAGMVIAYCEALLNAGINYQQKLHVTATDVSATAAYMAYIQLALYHVPAVVVMGNTLSLEVREVFYTPAHVMGWWDLKLKRDTP